MPVLLSLRALALETGYALATVSLALRDDPSIAEATRLKIQAAATKGGYQPNARIATAMRQIRRPSVGRRFDTLAWLVWPYPAGHQVREDYLQTMWMAAERRAAKLGWSVEKFSLVDPRMPHRSLGRILRNRGIHAAVLPPLHQSMERLDIDFSHLAAVAIGYSLSTPSLCRVGRSTIDSMEIVSGELIRRGYRRPAFVQFEGEQVKTHALPWAGFQILRENFPVLHRLPALAYKSLAEVPAWIKRHKPDVVIGDQIGILGTVQNMRLRVPEDIGFVLTTRAFFDEGIAGLDPNYALLAESAVDQAVQLAQQEDYGCPAVPRITLIGCSWFDGGTLRSADAKPSRVHAYPKP